MYLVSVDAKEVRGWVMFCNDESFVFLKFGCRWDFGWLELDNFKIISGNIFSIY